MPDCGCVRGAAGPSLDGHLSAGVPDDATERHPAVCGPVGHHLSLEYLSAARFSFLHLANGNGGIRALLYDGDVLRQKENSARAKV